MAELSSSLILRLVDRVSGPARAVGNALRGLDNNFRSVQAANARNMGQLQGQMFGAIAAGYGLKRALTAPLSVASSFETALLDIGQKADLTDSAIKSLGDRIRALAPMINQTSADVAKGVDFLAGMGLNPDDAMKMMAPIGRAATAYRAEIEDLAKAGYAAFDNLKVKAEDFGKALDVMAQAGKEGAFELRDMAQHFPSLTAAAQALKMEGVDGVAKLAAMLQIARKGAADGSEAATNTANLMQKIVSPETTKKFKKFGVDIRAELAKTQKSGGDIFEMIAEKTNKAIKGDLSKIGDLFEDAQVQKALRPLIQNLPGYRDIRDKSGKAKGVVDADFARRMITNAAQTAAFKAQLNDLAMTIGNILLPSFNQLMASIAPVIRSFEQFSAANPGLVGGAVKVAAALIGLKVAAVGARYAMAFMGAAALTAMTPLRALPAAAAMGGAALLALTRPLALVTAALRALKVALLGTGIGAALVAIGAAGTFIYNNWQGIGNFFSSFFASLQSNLSGDRFAPIISGLERLASLWKSVTGEIDTGKWEEWGTGAGASVAQSIERIADAIDRVVKGWQTFKSMWNGAVDILNTPLPTSGLPATSHSEGRKRFGQRGSLSVIGSMRDRAIDEGSGAGIISGLDQSGAAGAAGRNTGAAFTSNLDSQLEAAKEKIRSAVREMQGMLNFNASPTITPNIKGPVVPWGGISAPQKSSKIDMLGVKHATYSDAMNFDRV